MYGRDLVAQKICLVRAINVEIKGKADPTGVEVSFISCVWSSEDYAHKRNN